MNENVTERATQYYQNNTQENDREVFLKFHQQVARCVAYEAAKRTTELSTQEFEELCDETLYWFNED